MKSKKSTGRILKNIWPFILAAVSFIFVRIAVKNPHLVEEYYSDGFYTSFAGFVSSISRYIPFSLWDIFWLIIILAFLAGITMAILKRIRYSDLFLRLGQVLSILYTFFYISWGFNYFRPSESERIGLEVTKVNEQQFRTMLDSVILFVNRNYTEVKVEEYPLIEKYTEESFSNNSELLDINYPNGYRRPKKMIFSNLIAKFGISGYFGPFFNEINLNRRILPMEYPFLLAHEKAHQFGVSSEADANLVAFVVCTSSKDPALKYSGYLALLLYFLEDAQYFPDYGKYLGKLDKPVIEEIRFRQKYYYGIQNETMEKVHETVYDAYLKRNHVEHGIENYNQVVQLAVSWLNREAKISR